MNARVAPKVDIEAHPFAERFAAKVHVRDDGCWEWLGTRDRSYGRFYAGGGVDADKWAHRRSYEMFVAPIPDGMEIDHLCRFTFCVNPTHLEAVTPAENKRRAALARPAPDHGTHTRAAQGCKCESCAEAAWVRRTTYRARRREQFANGEIDIEHGTAYGYGFYQCRCDRCSDAGLAAAEASRRKRGVKPAPVMKHGTTSMYTKAKCRCGPCRQNWSEYWKAYRAKKRQEAAA